MLKIYLNLYIVKPISLAVIILTTFIAYTLLVHKDLKVANNIEVKFSIKNIDH